MRLFLLAAAAAITMLRVNGDDSTKHPMFPFPPNGQKPQGPLGVGSEKLLKSFTEREFLELVPRQSPRSAQRCPTEKPPLTHSTHWEWDPHRPNEIRWGSFIFPSPNFVCKTDRVEVLSGKTVEVPYLDSPYGRTYVPAQIDYYKREELLKCLNTLAKDYSRTHDERFARRIAVALDAWATCFPDYFMNGGKNGPNLVSPAQAEKLKWDVRRASDHNGFGHEWTQVELQAFDAIWNSKALRDLSAERGYDVRAHIVKNYFENEADFFTKRVPLESAVSTSLSEPLGVVANVATLVGRPDYIEYVNRYLELVIATNFVRDGMFPESFSYHHGYPDDLLKIAQGVSNYFNFHAADTPSLRVIKSQSDTCMRALRRSSTVQLDVALPNGNLAPFDDTFFGDAIVRNATRSALLPAYGHVMLGAGDGPSQTQVNLHFAEANNHVHADSLALALYAFGEELLDNNRYIHSFGRGFTCSTMAYSTVTIDRTTQFRGNGNLRGIGKVLTGGDLKTYEPGLAGVALAEVDGRRAYLNVADRRYERMIVLNTVDSNHPYLLDVFRVRGGHTHDYFLHGAITFPEVAQASFPLEPIAKAYPLLEAGETWNEASANKGESGNANWYGVFRDMSTARSPGNWNVTFHNSAETLGTCIHVADNGDSQVYLGKSPVGHRYRGSPEQPTIFNGWRPTLLVRRQAPAGEALQSLFVSVIEPFKGKPSITKVQRLPIEQADPAAVALEITFADGRKDVCIASLSDREQTVATTDKAYSLRGRFGLVSKANGRTGSWLIAGTELRCGDNVIAMPDGVQEGAITAVMRRHDGAALDAFVADSPLPEGPALKGRWVSLAFGPCKLIPKEDGSYPLNMKEEPGISQMFQIDHVERREGKTWICLTEDPALSIKDGVATEEVAPHRTFYGPPHFQIAQSRHVASCPPDGAKLKPSR